jgi:hypothetical protein
LARIDIVVSPPESRMGRFREDHVGGFYRQTVAAGRGIGVIELKMA